MLDKDVRQLFKKWKLYEKEGAFYITLCYENHNIRIERIYSKTKKDKKKMHNLLWDLYFEYEYDWTPLSNRQLAKLYGVNHQVMNNIVNDALVKMNQMMSKNRSWK